MKKQNYTALAFGLLFSASAFAEATTAQPTGTAMPPSNTTTPGAMDDSPRPNDVNPNTGGALTMDPAYDSHSATGATGTMGTGSSVPSDTADTTHSPSFHPPMENAMGGAMPSRTTVKDAQRALSANGHSLNVDGIAGPKTQSALREFQSKNGLPQTGQLDSATMNALNISGESSDTATDEPTEF